MTQQTGSRSYWPTLGESDEGWASFAYLWPNFVRIDSKNINNGTGTAAEKEATRKANLHSILALATQNNAQAREIIESRQTPNDDGSEPELASDGDAPRGAAARRGRRAPPATAARPRRGALT